MRIKFYCHVGQETGYGRAATELAIALVEAGVDLQIVPLNPSLSLPFTGNAAPLAPLASLAPDSADDQDFDAVIVHTMPLDCARVLADLPGGPDRPVYIAYTTWEGIDAPDSLVVGLLEFDQIWLPSSATADVLLASDAAPVDFTPRIKIVPHTFTPRAPAPPRAESGGEPYRFYWMGAWTTRKNPHGLIRAYVHAFEPSDLVELWMHCAGVDKHTLFAALAATGLPQAQLPRINLSNVAVTDDTIWKMHEAADCFVTATRGESWNLPAFEAMLSGRHVIAPSGMGHDDFLFEHAGNPAWDEVDITTAERVNSTHQPAFLDVELLESDRPGEIGFRTLGAQGLTSRSTWRDPDLVDLASLMRHAYERRCSSIHVRYDVAETFGHKAVARKAITYITEALNHG